MGDFLSHYGILGMRWGVRRRQEELDRAAGRSPREQARSDLKDAKWVRKGKGAKITKNIERRTSKEMRRYVSEIAARTPMRNADGKISKTFINEYNRKLAQIMNERVGDISAPSGKVLRYVAKRGEIGVHTALADQGYNMNQVAKGIHASGRIAYRKDTVRKT